VILGRGSSLIGGTIRTELTRSDEETVLVEGFFPICDPTDYPQEKTRVGMREIGLPYAADPAVTHHLARFLGRQLRTEIDDPRPRPVCLSFRGAFQWRRHESPAASAGAHC
jgi:hypothetical protein